MLAALAADRARVAELQTRILDLERTVSDLDRTLSQLRIEQSQAQERLDSYIYPVLTLPNDITRIIPPYPRFPLLTGQLSPMVLTHICRQWRDLALGNPMLWNTISPFLGERKPRIIELWLERSRSCPLYLKLGKYPRAADDLLETVILHRAHCEYLQIDLTAVHLHLFDGPMPLLRHLDLVLADEGSPESVSLQEVPLRTVAFNYSAALRVIVPWAQVTSLTLFDVSPSQSVPILVQTPNLVYCELGSCSDTNPGNPEPQREILLPCLESLILTGVDSPVTDFLPVLIVPALHKLEVSESSLLPNSIDALTAFISTSGCRLKELHITDVLIMPEASHRQAFPLLRKLSFMARW
ncbi:hypothetical protein DFH06DRAFT_1338185 [Mycena polygramma]|nr:hypothetical protein DFH06DRAFT_1338185 [Mycena polygramma]